MNVAMVNPRKASKGKSTRKPTKLQAKYRKFIKTKTKSFAKKGIKPKTAMKRAAKAWKQMSKGKKMSYSPKITLSWGKANKGKRKSRYEDEESNPKRKKRRKARKSYAENPKRKRRKARRTRRYDANPKRKRRKVRHEQNKRRYYRPHKRRKSRSNPEYITPGVGFGGRFKQQLYFLPKKGTYFPKWEEVKAHPIYTVLGVGIGGFTSATLGGFGRMLGGKNVLMSEIFGIAGNLIGTEVPARLVAMLPFKGSHVMSKSIRISGLVITAISAVLGLLRLVMSAKKTGVKGLLTWKGMGAISFKKPSEVLATIGLGVMSKDNPVADLVTSGVQQGYKEFAAPQNISDSFLQGEYEKSVFKVDGVEPKWWESGIGDPSLTQKIAEYAAKLGLGEDEIAQMAQNMEGVGYFDPEKEGELPGVGEAYVPKERNILNEFVV